MDAIKIDKEFKALIPPLASEELEQLEASIKEHGCRDPLVVWNGTLVDGHNRLEICERHDIDYDVTRYDFADRTAAKLWIIDNQFARRNLADIDRIDLQKKRAEITAAEAKKNQVIRKGKQPGATSATLRDLSPIKTSKVVAKAAGVGERTYDAGKLILDAAAKGEISPEDVDAIRRKEKSIHRVAKDIKEKRQKNNRQAQRVEAVSKTEPQFFDNVHVGDFRDHFDKVADNSLSLIFTDPPYDLKACELYAGLAEFAAAKLCEGGSLITYIGHLQLPTAFAELCSRLRFWWPLCCLHSGEMALMKEYGIRVGWKPVLWFVKTTRDDKQDIVLDVMSGGKEKSHHDWQQSQSEAEYWIEHLCPADGIVCDPFLGGGTTAAAAIKLKRKWVGFEKDHDQAVLAMQRCKV